MKILIVAATWMEVKLIADELELIEKIDDKINRYHYAGNDIDILIAGIGITATTFHLTSILHKNSYELALNAGIAGSWNKNLKIWEIVNVISE
jgi:futalosine hydrolase